MAAAARQAQVVASRAVRKMSVFQRRGMATSPLWWGSSGEGEHGRRAP
jgi:hypothetical protein